MSLNNKHTTGFLLYHQGKPKAHHRIHRAKNWTFKMIFSQRRHLAWNQGSQLCTTPAPKMASFENQGMSASRHRQGPHQRWHLYTKGSQLCIAGSRIKDGILHGTKNLSSAPHQHQRWHLLRTKGCQLCTTGRDRFKDGILYGWMDLSTAQRQHQICMASFVELKDLSSAPQQHQRWHLLWI